MALVREVSGSFPGLETEEALRKHQETVLRFMNRQSALCVKDGEKIIGVLLFSKRQNMICCLAVLPEYRKRGVASALLAEALKNLDAGKGITVSTFREGDERGAAPHALYKKFGFVEDELMEDFGCPTQKFILRA